MRCAIDVSVSADVGIVIEAAPRRPIALSARYGL
jgi:hypothetical protein